MFLLLSENVPTLKETLLLLREMFLFFGKVFLLFRKCSRGQHLRKCSGLTLEGSVLTPKESVPTLEESVLTSWKSVHAIWKGILGDCGRKVFCTYCPESVIAIWDVFWLFRTVILLFGK